MKHWYQKSIISVCLYPISLIYRAIIFLRLLAYRIGLFKRYSFPVPVIVVGNITVGGTGKTPFVIWLAERLQQKGYRPGIVSRGYGGKTDHYPMMVNEASSPSKVGDEPLLIVQRTACPMVVDPNRARAVKHLLANSDCNIVISDDGLQHYALKRDMEIVIVDGERQFGNQWCLPAGPLREPIKRLNEVDLVLINGQTQGASMKLTAGELRQLSKPSNTRSPDAFKNQSVHAVAGIGNPNRFYNTLNQLNISYIPHSFPDHHNYQAKDFAFADDGIIIMTEKDAVKCRQFNNQNIWVLPVSAEVTAEVNVVLDAAF